MTLGGAAQVAAARCPNERTLVPTACSYNGIMANYIQVYGVRTAVGMNKVVIKTLQGSVVIQTVLDGLTIIISSRC